MWDWDPLSYISRRYYESICKMATAKSIRGWVIEFARVERLLSEFSLESRWRKMLDRALLACVWLFPIATSLTRQLLWGNMVFSLATLAFCCSSNWIMSAVWTTNCPIKWASSSGDWSHCWQNMWPHHTHRHSHCYVKNSLVTPQSMAHHSPFYDIRHFNCHSQNSPLAFSVF